MIMINDASIHFQILSSDIYLIYKNSPIPLGTGLIM